MRCLAACVVVLAAGVAGAAPVRQEMPGEPGFALLYGRAKRFCGGFEVRAIRTHDAIADVETAPLYLLEPPPKLGLDAAPPISGPELQRFSSWLVRFQGTLAMIRRHADASTQDIAVLAHTIVAERYAAELLIRTAVPKSLLGGDDEDAVIQAFCDGVGEMADPILDDIQRRLSACRALLPDADPGFWDAVCSR